MRALWTLLRLALVALAAVSGFWLLSQLTVATWLSGAAQQREASWQQGLSPWHWSFSDPDSVVWPGSHGLDLAHRAANELSLVLPADGVASLSLALRDEWIDLGAVDRVRIDLDTVAPVRILLLPKLVRQQRTWAQADLGTGDHQLDLPLNALPESRSKSLQLRLEAGAGTRIRLRHLALIATPCESAMTCAEHRRFSPWFATPEQLLAFRDVQAMHTPAVSLEAGGRLGAAGRWLNRYLPDFSDLHLRGITLALLGLILFSVMRRLLPGKALPSTRRTRWELAITLGAALILLLSGWPARDTPLEVSVTLMLCLVTLALLPAPTRPDWRWVGTPAAWWSAMAFTFIALLLAAPLLLLDDPTGPTHRDLTHWLRYPAWALLQQWLLIAAITPRMRHLLPSVGSAALGCGVVFGLLHAPNFALMLFTFVGGTAWSAMGQRHRALLPLAVSHAILGLWLMYVAPSWLLRSAEIGGRYLMLP